MDNAATATLAPDTTNKKEVLRLVEVLFNKKDKLTADYKNTIRQNGSLLTASMVYAYAKGLNDAIKILTKEIKDEKSV